MVIFRVFIDTCVLDRENYNFQSRALRSFVEAAQELEVVLVLPSTTEEEILRHQKETATKVNDEWVKMGRSPHLKRIQKGPFEDLEEEILKALSVDWEAFKGSFSELKCLATEDASLTEVMGWYSSGSPPFGPGRKKHEFPDAVVRSNLLTFAKVAGPVLVVSSDNDFTLTCKETPELLRHSSTLPEVTELFLKVQEENARKIDHIHSLLGDGTEGPFFDAVSEHFNGHWFRLLDEVDGNVEMVAVEGVSSVEFEVVKLGDLVEVAFSADVFWSAQISFADPDAIIWDNDFPKGYFASRRVEGRYHSSDMFDGTFTIKLSEDKSHFDVQSFEFDTYEIEIIPSEGDFEADPEVRDDDQL